MNVMSSSGDPAMTTVWVPMSGQSWIGAEAAFLGMWTGMMAAMMLPSLVPLLWRYRRAIGRAGETRPNAMTAFVGGGYFCVWILLGAVLYPLGSAVVSATARHAALARAAPAALAVIVLAAGALQLSPWKARHLERCRAGGCLAPRARPRPLRARPFTEWLRGLRLGFDCVQCCAGLTTVLLVTGLMDVPAMLAVTAAMTLERLAPAGKTIARTIGLVMIAAGCVILLRAAGLRFWVSALS